MKIFRPIFFPQTIAAGMIASLLSFHASTADAQSNVEPKQTPTELQTGVGFASVAEALAAVKAKPGVRVSETQPERWTIISEPGGMVLWSFAPPAHPAYPAVVRRAVASGSDRQVRIFMTGLCEAEKAACDKLMEEFRQLNDRAAAERRGK